MSKNMAAKLSSLPCFEAFGVMFCPDVCSYFCRRCFSLSLVVLLDSYQHLKEDRGRGAPGVSP